MNILIKNIRVSTIKYSVVIDNEFKLRQLATKIEKLLLKSNVLCDTELVK